MSEHTASAYRKDPDLVKACLKGDKAAWDELVNRYARLVYSIPRRYGMSPEDVEDVFQNVFAIVFQRLHDLRDRTLLAAWLITITQRECHRLRKTNPQLLGIDDFERDPHALPAEQAEILELQHLVRQAISQLEPGCQKLITALFLDPRNPSYQEIAMHLRLPVGSIGPNRARCFKKLEAILLAMGVDLD